MKKISYRSLVLAGVSVLLFAFAWYIFNVLNWGLPGWLLAAMAFFGVGFMFRVYAMWVNREQVAITYDMAKMQFGAIKQLRKIEKEKKEKTKDKVDKQ